MSKPVVKLVGEDGNVFAIIGKVARTLRRVDSKLAAEFQSRAMSSESYGEVLRLCTEYVEID